MKLFRLFNPWNENGARRQARRDARVDFPSESRPELGYHGDVVQAANRDATLFAERWGHRDRRDVIGIRSRANRLARAERDLAQIEAETAGTPFRQPGQSKFKTLGYLVVFSAEAFLNKSAFEAFIDSDTGTWVAGIGISILILLACHSIGAFLHKHQMSAREKWIGGVPIVFVFGSSIGLAFLRASRQIKQDEPGKQVWVNHFNGSEFIALGMFQLFLAMAAILLAYMATHPVWEAREKARKAKTDLEQAIVGRNKRHENVTREVDKLSKTARFLSSTYETENARHRQSCPRFEHGSVLVPPSITEFDPDQWRKIDTREEEHR